MTEAIKGMMRLIKNDSCKCILLALENGQVLFFFSFFAVNVFVKSSMQTLHPSETIFPSSVGRPLHSTSQLHGYCVQRECLMRLLVTARVSSVKFIVQSVRKNF